MIDRPDAVSRRIVTVGRGVGIPCVRLFAGEQTWFADPAGASRLDSRESTVMAQEAATMTLTVKPLDLLAA